MEELQSDTNFSELRVKMRMGATVCVALLKDLEARGVLESRVGTTVNGRKAKYYRLTYRGRVMLTHLREALTI